MNSIMKKVLYIFDSKQKLQVLGILVAITIGAILELVGVSIIFPFVNVIMTPDIIQNSPYLSRLYLWGHFTDDTHFVAFLIFGIVVVYIVKNAFICYMYNLQYHFVYDNQKALSIKMMNCYMRQPYSYHLVHGSSEMIQSIMKDVDMFFATVLGAVQFVTEVIVLAVLVCYLFVLDSYFTTGIAIIMLLFMLFYFFILKKRIQNLGIQYRKHNANTNKHILEGFGGIKELKVLEREDYFVDAYGKSYHDFAECYRKFQLYSILPRPLMEAVSISGLMLIVAIKVLAGTDMEVFVPILSAFAVAALRMLPSFSRITSYLSMIVFNKSAIDSVYKDLQEVERLQNESKQDEKNNLVFKKILSLKNVSFSYAGSESEVIHSVDLEIEKYQSIGLMGPSGQGKTTLADIILGVLLPTKGKVMVDDLDINQYIHAWHKCVGYIPQSIFLTDDTIRKNIAYGIKDEDIDDQQVWRALEEAQLKSFVEGLECGLETEVGERGIRLSGGQRQRIGIARALYHNPEVLILDEATSALDHDTESAVMDAINRLQGNKTLIIIAHRLTTIKNCDIIYKVNQGRIENVDKELLFGE